MTSSPAADPRLLAPGRRAVTIGIVLGISAVGFEALGVSTAMPVVARSLHGESLYGWAFSAFLLGQLIGIVSSGADADTHGPKRAYLLALGLFAGGLLVCGLSQSMPILVVGRFIAGTGSGAVLLLNWALIARLYDEAVRARMLAVASSAWIVPGLVGPIAAGWVADHIGWRVVFFAYVPLLALVGVLLLPAIHLPGTDQSAVEPTGERFWDVGRAQRNVAALVMAAGAGLVLGGLDSQRLWLVAVLVVVGLALMAVAGPSLFPSGTLVAATGLPAVVATYALLLTAFTGAEVFLPFVLGRLHGFSATTSGLILTAGTSTWATGSWLQARHPDRWADPHVRRWAVLVFGIGVALAGTLAFDVPAVIGYLGWGVCGIGMGIAFTSATDATFRVVSAERTGIASSATQLAGALGSALVAGVNGALINIADRTGRGPATGVRWAFALDLVVVVLAFGASARLRVPGSAGADTSRPVEGSPAPSGQRLRSSDAQRVEP